MIPSAGRPVARLQPENRVTAPDLRERYLAWTRRALPALLLPLALTAAVQSASATSWWSAGPAPEPAARYLFIAVAAAAIVMGRSIRERDTRSLPLEVEALVVLSWRICALALAPAAIGAVLAFMTRSVADYYILLAVTLVGLAMLYPRFDQWQQWAGYTGERVE